MKFVQETIGKIYTFSLVQSTSYHLCRFLGKRHISAFITPDIFYLFKIHYDYLHVKTFIFAHDICLRAERRIYTSNIYKDIILHVNIIYVT